VLSRHPSTTPARRRFAAAAGLVLALAGLTACGDDPAATGAMPSAPGFPDWAPTSFSSTQSPPNPSRPEPKPRELSPQLADPAIVSVPAVNISAKLQPLHLGTEGRLVAPKYGIAGWYAAGPEPGEPGAAVIAGHVDSKVGPDTFYNLRQITIGEHILVGLTDGSKLMFRVVDIKQFPVDNFPSTKVYGHTRKPELRLITCAGDYDHSAGHYKDNLVVFADLAN
jgi:sortase (surface protein transpeptidase)